MYKDETVNDSDVTFANDPILLNGSLVRTKGTESYLVRAVLFIVGSLPAINPLTRLYGNNANVP